MSGKANKSEEEARYESSSSTAPMATESAASSSPVVDVASSRSKRRSSSMEMPSGESLSKLARPDKKTIFYEADASGESFPVIIADNSSFDIFCAKKGVSNLLDDQNREVYDFGGLENGQKYKLGTAAATMLPVTGQAMTTTVATVSQRSHELDQGGKGHVSLVDHAVSLVISAWRHLFQQQIDYSRLPPVSQVQPLLLDRPAKPESYICPAGFLESLLETISSRIDQHDSSAPSRVPPMALVGCTRSGKTATLEEIATALPGFLTSKPNGQATVIYVTFNEYAFLKASEQGDPLQALLRRLAFTITRAELKPQPDVCESAYQRFEENFDYFDPARLQGWLKDERIVLLIDELSNLKELTAKSENSCAFGDFLRSNFISKRGRYLVFTSHTLDAVESFGDIVDSSSLQSSRLVDIQDLPLVNDLAEAVKHLNIALDGAREAVYYGLLPGMIFDHSSTGAPFLKMYSAVNEFLLLPLAEKERWIVSILGSLSSGSIDDVPVQLHCLLVTKSLKVPGMVSRLALISWVPFVLQTVLNLTPLTMDSWLDKARIAVRDMCLRLVSAEEKSGKGFESMFALAYFARCVSRRPYGNWLPEEWTQDARVAVLLNPYDRIRAGKFFKDCENWHEVKPYLKVQQCLNVQQGIPVLGPAIVVIVPGHAQFRDYDLVAAFFDETQKLVECRAFQLKEGNINQAKPSKLNDISERYLIKGEPPPKSKIDDNGWNVPDEKAIDGFFGDACLNWTPRRWKELDATFEKVKGINKSRTAAADA